MTSFEGKGDGGRSVECAGSNRVVSFVHEAPSWLPGVLQNRLHFFGMLSRYSITVKATQSFLKLAKRSPKSGERTVTYKNKIELRNVERGAPAQHDGRPAIF